MTKGDSEQQPQQRVSHLVELVVTVGLRTCSSKETAHISFKKCLHRFSDSLWAHIPSVGGKLSCADVQMLKCTLMLDEKYPAPLAYFPNVNCE